MMIPRRGLVNLVRRVMKTSLSLSPLTEELMDFMPNISTAKPRRISPIW